MLDVKMTDVKLTDQCAGHVRHFHACNFMSGKSNPFSYPKRLITSGGESDRKVERRHAVSVKVRHALTIYYTLIYGA